MNNLYITDTINEAAKTVNFEFTKSQIETELQVCEHEASRNPAVNSGCQMHISIYDKETPLTNALRDRYRYSVLLSAAIKLWLVMTEEQRDTVKYSGFASMIDKVIEIYGYPLKYNRSQKAIYCLVDDLVREIDNIESKLQYYKDLGFNVTFTQITTH